MKREREERKESAISNLRNAYGSSIVQKIEDTKKLVMDSPNLNYIFGGGYPLGRVTEMFGPESGGKSVLSSYIGGQFQRREDSDQRIVVYVDIEHTFDQHYANNVGLSTDSDQFILIHPLHGEEAFTIVQKFVETREIGLIIWDSTTATPTAASTEEDYGKKSFGSGALLFSEGLKKLNPYLSRYNTSLNLLTQMRAKIGGFIRPGMPTDVPSGGGYAPRYYASWRAKVSRGEDIMNGKEVIGNVINIKNTKSKLAPPKRSAKLNLFYASGFNPDEEYIDFFIKLGIITQKGAWYENIDWGMRCQGKAAVLSFLKENEELYIREKDHANSTFANKSVLDEQEVDDLFEDESEE